MIASSNEMAWVFPLELLQQSLGSILSLALGRCWLLSRCCAATLLTSADAALQSAAELL